MWGDKNSNRKQFFFAWVGLMPEGLFIRHTGITVEITEGKRDKGTVDRKLLWRDVYCGAVQGMYKCVAGYIKRGHEDMAG